jgi:hypothetical protein
MMPFRSPSMINLSGSNSPLLAASVAIPNFVVIPNEVRDLKIPRHARHDKEYSAFWGGAVYSLIQHIASMER